MGEQLSGGVSDGCWTGALGVPTIDGLGPVGALDHTAAEWIELVTLERRLELSVRLIEAVAQRARRSRPPRRHLAIVGVAAGPSCRTCRACPACARRPRSGAGRARPARHAPRPARPGSTACCGTTCTARRVAVGQVVEVGGRPQHEDLVAGRRVGAQPVGHGRWGRCIVGEQRVAAALRTRATGRRAPRRARPAGGRGSRAAARAGGRRRPRPAPPAAGRAGGSSGGGSCRRPARPERGGSQPQPQQQRRAPPAEAASAIISAIASATPGNECPNRLGRSLGRAGEERVALAAVGDHRIPPVAEAGGRQRARDRHERGADDHGGRARSPPAGA